MSEEVFVCSICGEEHPISSRRQYDEQNYCVSCFEDNFVLCENCGERVPISESVEGDDFFICQDCCDDYYHYCSRCGHLVHDEEAYDHNGDVYCPSCWEDVRDSLEGPIHPYEYKPEPIFYGEGPLYLGVELEIDGGGEDDCNAEEIFNVGNALEPLIYLKHDGSLNMGLEIVTHPMSLDYHRTRMPWQDVIDKAKQLGYTSHNAGTCGLHVHVSKDALGNTIAAQDKTISKILLFVEQHWNELFTFSRRTRAQMEEWACRYGYSEDPLKILDSAKRAYRHSCINVNSGNTIEFRIFRGTLKYNTLIATLELVQCIVAFALEHDSKYISRCSWLDFVQNLKASTPELITYLKERSLYVNAPIVVDEEDA